MTNLFEIVDVRGRFFRSLFITMLLSTSGAVFGQSYTFTTIAGGTGISGSTDATGTAARFNNPIRLAVDGSGNIYVADYTNHTIRKISSAGVVTTLAGLPGTPGYADGAGSAARFNFPADVAVDSSGNVYVPEYNNNTIRKISSAGVVTTLAGAPGQGNITDGVGTAARFNQPYGVAVDSGGNVYVADSNNSSIRKITSVGVVSTFAGAPLTTGSADGTGSSARFHWPSDVTVDGSGNVFVADRFNQIIRSEEHTSELQSRLQLVCRLLLEK